MKPPICELCHNDFGSEYFHRRAGGSVVQFADYQLLPEGAAGQAQGLEWFCDEHLASAQALAHLPHAVALQQLTARYGVFPAYQALPALDPALWVVEVGAHPAKVFRLVRQAMQVSPALAKQLLDRGSFKVISAWPAQFQVWQEALQEAGAKVEIRYPSSRNIQAWLSEA